MERVLCVYATRQVDSNLMMASTVFRGMREAGYDVDMVFIGSTDAIDEFKSRYAKYFNGVFYRHISRPLKEISLYRKSPLLYSYLRSFLLDGFVKLNVGWLRDKITRRYDRILSFIPPVISGRYALKIKEMFLKETPLIQFWTDPLSLGRLDDVNEIPKSRGLHKLLETNLLMGGGKQGGVLLSSADGNGSAFAS